MSVYRCDWCGRFYSSPLPEGSACPNHIPEHNERLSQSIERFNAKLTKQPKTLAEVYAEQDEERYEAGERWWNPFD